MTILKSIHIQGFKSIRDARVDLGRVNVLIGANASGKSNLVAFFRFLQNVAFGHLQDYAARSGGASGLLRFGPKVTNEIRLCLEFETDGSAVFHNRLAIQPTDDDRFTFTEESLRLVRPALEDGTSNVAFPSRSGHLESILFQSSRRQHHQTTEVGETLLDAIAAFVNSVRFYQVHDTSANAAVRRSYDIADGAELYFDARNLPSVLFKYRVLNGTFYRRIVATVRQVFPQLDDFVLTPDALAPTQIRLNWRERGQDNLFGPHQLSDGTLRFIALATLLLQPEEELPKVIVIDEPELGLHPYAIGVLASLVKAASRHCQVIVATQSVTLLDQFEPADVIVVERDRVHNATEFKRLNADELAVWKDEYENPIALGELWERNIIGGGPH